MTRARTADCTSANATVGKIKARTAAQGSDQPGKPPGGSQRSFTAKSMTSRMESQKAGRAMPSWLRNITPQSPDMRWFAAALIPSASASMIVNSIPEKASEIVSGSRSATRSATGTRKEWLIPKSPLSASQTQWR